MNAAQAHRGPDDEGVASFRFGPLTLCLGHRRLSILDLSAAGHQPMLHPETGDAVVYNGELYNHEALRQELEAAGERFTGHGDTEVLLHALARWGTDAFPRLRGMYAAAFYRPRSQQLILCRDPLGIKPLYFAQLGAVFVFASELRAFGASGLIPSDVEPRALAGLLAYGSVPAPLAMIRGVEMLGGGTWLELSPPQGAAAPQARSRRFWAIPAESAPPARPQAVSELRGRLQEAARSHLLSDVPVGVFLSSGIDSTAVAALCQAVASDPIDTFTICLSDDEAMDESHTAARTAALLGTHHHTIELPEAVVQEETQRWLLSLDQPSLDGLNTFIISGAVRSRGIKVALSGLGGDEVFGGYPGFWQVPAISRVLRWAHVLPAGLRGALAEAASRGRNQAQREKARALATSSASIEKLMFQRRRVFSDRELRGFGFDSEALGLEDTYLLRTEPDVSALSGSPEGLISALEIRHYMANTLLRDSDVFGMAHGLEIRVPLLDQALVDYAMTLPGAWRVRSGERNKPLLTDALAGILPPHSLGLPKRGFNLQQAHWMRGALRDRFEAGVAALEGSGQLDPGTVRAVWSDFQSGRHGDHWARAWLLGVIGAWLCGDTPTQRTAVAG